LRIDGTIYKANLEKVEDSESNQQLRVVLEGQAREFLHRWSCQPHRDAPNGIWFFKMSSRV